MSRRRDAKSLHRPNPAQSTGECGGLARDLCDELFLPLRKEMFALYSLIQLQTRSMRHQRKNSFAYLT